MTTHPRPPETLTPERQDKIRRVAGQRQHDLTLVLANIHDPHNVSAIYRSCDAFGVAGVHLYYTDTAFPVLGRRTSASARKWVETARHKDPRSLHQALREKDCQICCTGFSPTARPLIEVDFTRPTAIILGNEHRGADAELLALSDMEMYIPMQGMVQSLNVSVAAAVILYEAWRQRHAAGMFETSSLQPEALEAMVRDWSRR